MCTSDEFLMSVEVAVMCNMVRVEEAGRQKADDAMDVGDVLDDVDTDDTFACAARKVK